MIPILFEKTATAFTTNGIGRLADCIACSVTEERNGVYELEMQYPVTGKLFNNLFDMGIIGVIHNDIHDIQPFDIYKISAPLDGVVTVYAHHISYRLNNLICYPFSAANCKAAINGIRDNSLYNTGWVFQTSKEVDAAFTLTTPKNVRSILLGEEGSILDVYGPGDFEFDKFTVSFTANKGQNSGVTIRYGKNMVGVTKVADVSGVFNCVSPFWTNGNTTVTLSTASPYALPSTPIGQNIPATLDMSEDFNGPPSEYALRNAATQWLDTHQPWLGTVNIKVDLVAMWQTPEYEKIANVQRIHLCDTVSVYNTDLGIIAENGKVVKVVYDVLGERFTQLEIGDITKKFVAITGQSIAEQLNMTAVVNRVLNQLPAVSISSSDDGSGNVTLTGVPSGDLRSSDDGAGNVTITGSIS